MNIIKQRELQSVESFDMSSSESATLYCSTPFYRTEERIKKLEGKSYNGSKIKIIGDRTTPYIVEADYGFLASLGDGLEALPLVNAQSFTNIDELKTVITASSSPLYDQTLIDRVSLTKDGGIRVTSGNIVLKNVHYDPLPLIDSPNTNIFIEGSVDDLNLGSIKTKKILNLSHMHIHTLYVPATAEYAKLILPHFVLVVKFEEGCSLKRVQLNPRRSATRVLLPYSMRNSILEFPAV